MTCLRPSIGAPSHLAGIVAGVQRRLYEHLLQQDMRFFHDRHSTEFMTRLGTAANGVRDLGRDARMVVQATGLGDADVAAIVNYTNIGTSAGRVADLVMPAFSSGQWAGTLPLTLDLVPSGDLLFMCGGGILAHPQGVAAGVQSVRDAWGAWQQGIALSQAALSSSALQTAMEMFKPTGLRG